MTQEFNKGDLVTFHAYDTAKPIKAKVIEVTTDLWNDKRVAYKLHGINKPLISHTTGRSIVESRYFELSKASELFKS